ncbi:hypothetical protein VPH35_106694 [Triticum aestivum]
MTERARGGRRRPSRSRKPWTRSSRRMHSSRPRAPRLGGRSPRLRRARGRQGRGSRSNLRSRGLCAMAAMAIHGRQEGTLGLHHPPQAGFYSKGYGAGQVRRMDSVGAPRPEGVGGVRAVGGRQGPHRAPRRRQDVRFVVALDRDVRHPSSSPPCSRLDLE